jgi:hypothetical protein
MSYVVSTEVRAPINFGGNQAIKRAEETKNIINNGRQFSNYL